MSRSLERECPKSSFESYQESLRGNQLTQATSCVKALRACEESVMRLTVRDTR